MTKKVRVMATIEYEIDVPSDWTKKDIEFHRNDGTWCASNMMDELVKIEQREGCLCWNTKFEVLP